MIYLKTDEEIELMRISNQLVAKTLGEVAKAVKPGVSTLELDKIAEAFIRDNGGTPAFLNYQGFPNTLCTSVNEQVVHGIPNNTPLKEGDVVSVDCGVLLNDFYGDSAYTFPIGEVAPEVKALLDATKESLYRGIEQAVENNRLGDVGNAIQTYTEERGYTVVREMVGHGIGKNLHEAPEVANYGRKGNGTKLKSGMVIAIEPMINLGKRQIVQEDDGWTIRTIDKKVSAHYEHTVAVRKGKADILSSFKFVEEVLHLQSEK
ncbi:MAG: type I methionyl aminopeptidase [Carboxylicivirga sp.]|jgi:methionyl aminopeptidase|nr:type I methionyl aminopeptidase [Carboxylicivirga sp.]